MLTIREVNKETSERIESSIDDLKNSYSIILAKMTELRDEYAKLNTLVMKEIEEEKSVREENRKERSILQLKYDKLQNQLDKITRKMETRENSNRNFSEMRDLLLCDSNSSSDVLIRKIKESVKRNNFQTAAEGDTTPSE